MKRLTAILVCVLLSAGIAQAAEKPLIRIGARVFTEQTLLAEITAKFAPYQEKYRHLQAHPAEVEGILRDGATRARALALPIIEKARHATGLA